ncbi:ornithine decarboxylase-like isoform X1 [Amblyomma americanum]
MLWSRILLSSAGGRTFKSGASIATSNGSLFLRFKSSKTLPAQETEDGTLIYTQGAMPDVARDILSKRHADNGAFFVCDLRDMAKKVELWREFLPRVAPFYAIKACRDPVVLNGLNTLGVNFDCSNKGELSAVLNMGVSPSRIVYANTVKSPPDIEFAHHHGVRLMTFDSAEELAKVKDKGARLLLRIQADETGSQHSFNTKFGCTFSEAKSILQQAQNMGCSVVGVSFHVGCAYQSTEIFSHTIARAKAIFDVAANMGYNMTVLDIGGGFPGGLRRQHYFRKVCESIRLATDLHFPESSGVHVIAEPGQFFVTSCYALIVQVIGKRLREVVVDGISQPHQELFINESKDNCVSRNLYDYLDVSIWPLQEPLERPNDVLTTVWGGTCNPIDCIQARKPLFEAHVGEWLLMDNIGAYSLSRASGFNGLPFAPVHYIAADEDACAVRRILDASPLRSGYCQPESVLKEALLAQWRTETTTRDSRVAAAAAGALQC